MGADAMCFCIASGPSLTRADCDKTVGHYVIAVNNSWQIAPHANAVFASDYDWWQVHGSSVPAQMEQWASHAARPNYIKHENGLSSGGCAILLAAKKGYKQIGLLGYDCSIEHGAHWHGDHSGTLSNPDDVIIRRWFGQFARLSEDMKVAGVRVVNFSRSTALSCFERGFLGGVYGY